MSRRKDVPDWAEEAFDQHGGALSESHKGIDASDSIKDAKPGNPYAPPGGSRRYGLPGKDKEVRKENA